MNIYLVLMCCFCAAQPEVKIDKDFKDSEDCVLLDGYYVIKKNCKLSGKADKVRFEHGIVVEFADFKCDKVLFLDSSKQINSSVFNSPQRSARLSMLKSSPRRFNNNIGTCALQQHFLNFSSLIKVTAYGSVTFSDNASASAFNSFVVPDNQELNVAGSFKLSSNGMVFDDNFDVQKLMDFRLTKINAKTIYEALKQSSYKDFADELMYGMCFAANGGMLDKVLEEGNKEDLPENLEKEKFEEKTKFFDASKDNTFVRGLLLLKYNSASDNYEKVMEKYNEVMQGIVVSVELKFDSEVQPSTPEAQPSAS